MLIPQVTGQLNVAGSFVFHTGGDSELASEVISHPRSLPVPAISGVGQTEQVSLDWDPVAGATEYRVFRTPTPTTHFPDGAVPLAVTSASVTAATVPAAAGEAWYAVSSVLAAKPTMSHRLIAVTALAPVQSTVVSVGDATVAEGDAGTRTANFTVSLSEPSASAVTVNYATADGTGPAPAPAVAPSDYAAKAGTLTFAAGKTSLVIKVPVKGNTVDEADEEFSVGLSGATGAVVGDGTGKGTIVDDDPGGTDVRVAIGDVAVHEGDAGTRTALFTVSLSRSSTSTVTVSFATVEGTATKPGDYAAKTGTLSFPPGTTNLSVKVPVKADSLAEGNHSFSVALSLASGAAISDAGGVGTIVDDD